MFSPSFDSPQEKKGVLSWMESSRFRNVELLTVGHLVARGIKEFWLHFESYLKFAHLDLSVDDSNLLLRVRKMQVAR